MVGGITRVIPITGLTAPFLAQGGSSMIASWITVALILRVSDAARRPAPRAQGWSEYAAEQPTTGSLPALSGPGEGGAA